MHDIHISLMEHNDVSESTTVLSRAMLNNPLHRAIFQGNGENERLAIEKVFHELFTALPGIVFLAKAHATIIGVMRMKSCVGREVEKESTPMQRENTLSWRKSVWHREWAAHDPSAQHWHLGPIGVLPAYQGMGVGSRLMQRFCNEVDACSATAYLETDLDENVRFYNKFGFETIATSILFDVENRYMQRAPR